MLSIREISLLNFPAIWGIARILSECGDDMYQKYNISHWKNSVFKSFLIVFYSAVRYSRTIMGVYDDKNMIGTYQISRYGDSLHFGKFAISPNCSVRGLGSYCLEQMSLQAAEWGCNKLRCEVYDQSTHAMNFYLRRGFVEDGTDKTMKYTEIKLVKHLQQ